MQSSRTTCKNPSASVWVCRPRAGRDRLTLGACWPARLVPRSYSPVRDPVSKLKKGGVSPRGDTRDQPPASTHMCTHVHHHPTPATHTETNKNHWSRSLPHWFTGLSSSRGERSRRPISQMRKCRPSERGSHDSTGKRKKNQ